MEDEIVELNKQVTKLNDLLDIAEHRLEYISIQPMIATQAFPAQMGTIAKNALKEIQRKRSE